MKTPAKNRMNALLSVFFFTFSIIWLAPVAIVFYNSFKDNSAISLSPFSLPDSESFVGLRNYIGGMTHGNYPFYMSLLYSVLITVLSVGLILLFCSMAAWYINRSGTLFCKMVYYLCVFSMVVPFQMVMFTLSKTADSFVIPLNTPWTIPIIYLGFGTGLSVFMFVGFIKSIPIEIEEAAMIDGCNPLQTFFIIVLPIMKPTYISVGILETMWIWNDFLLPYLVLDTRKYKTISIVVQYMKGSYGRIDMGAIMAALIMAVIPVIIFYLACQKHIIKGVAAGAVKG